ncbi:MAG: T9SS type A sorting domain-containing protein, partial [Bacteroidota bacterium]
DLDSDNDGIPDVVEMGGVDADGDGLTDNASDNDGDGWSNTYDSDNAGTPFAELDTDGDGLNNNIDLDSDSDGIADAYEANDGDLPAGMNADGQYTSLTDTDGDGYHDNLDSDNGGTALPVANTDGVGNADFADTDADGDGVQDYIEAFDDDNGGDSNNDFVARAAAFGNTAPYTTDDADFDGVPDWLEDDDADGTANYLDPDNGAYLDTDGDGLVDLHDQNQGGVAYGAVSGQPDADSNGTPNQYDDGDLVSLPVELVFFNGSFDGEEVLLSWRTASELDNDYFEIEKSIDGSEFYAIGVVEGNGTTNETINYGFVDSNPLDGINYYRMRQVDFDGAFEYSNVISVVASFTEFGFDVYPNPAVSELNARFKRNVGQVEMLLVDLRGVIVKRHVENPALGENVVTLDVTGVTEGVYFLMISAEGETEKHKVVIRD